MKPDTALKLSFAFMACVFAFTLWISFNGGVPRDFKWMLNFYCSLPFMVTAIVELNASDRIDRKEKIMWTFGFIAMTLLTGILYFISQRKRVLSN